MGYLGLDILWSILAFVLVTSASLFSIDKVLSIRSQLEFGDNNIRWVDGDLNAGTVLSCLGYLINVDAPSLSVDSVYFASAVFVVASHNQHFVISSDRKRLNVVLLSQIFGEVGAHELISEVRRCAEVGLSAFSSGAGYVVVSLHNRLYKL